MQALIIGYGFVGKATELTLKSMGVDPVTIHDPQAGFSAQVKWDFDCVFICVPTNLRDGKLETDIVDEVYNKFKGHQIIRSTLPPESVCLYPEATIWPEFLREVTFNIDATQPQVRDVVGIKEIEGNMFYDLIRKHRAVDAVTPKEAAMFKMSRNAFLATKVTFANELRKKCLLLDIDYDAVKSLLQPSLDPATHWDVPGPDGKFGFGGKCLPKDTTHYATLSQDVLSSIILMLNTSHRED
tara:strand:- start:4671 stop:5393 length:723 start_codon:yes stop_codon:yes gene_type:complete